MGEKPKALYSNMVGVSQSVFEIRLEFALETPSDLGESSVETLADIRLSPQIAKALRDIMDQAIDVYEGAFGTIPMPTKAEEGNE